MTLVFLEIGKIMGIQSCEDFLPCVKAFSSSNEKISLDNLKKRVGEEKLIEIFEKEDLAHLVPSLRINQLVLDQNLIEIIYYGLACYSGEKISPSIFIGKCPEINEYDSPKTSGKGLKGLKERIRILAEISEDEVSDFEIILSRLGDREPPVGTVVYLSNGKTYRYEKIFARGGAYLSILRDQDDLSTIIITCRGTATRLSATGGLLSALNNALLEPGMMGVQAVWPDLKAYLSADDSIKKVTIAGKSQGGGHAQCLAPLIESGTPCSVVGLVTFCSIGVSRAVQRIFQEVFRNKAIDVRVYYNGGSITQGQMDFVPYVGGGHITIKGAKFISLQPGEEPIEEESIRSMSALRKIYYFFLSFKKGHTRQTTMKSYRAVNVTRKEPDSFLEGMRRLIAYSLHLITLTLLNPISYQKFFNREFSSSNVNEAGFVERVELLS